jgi:hypothetical protein
MTITEEEQKDQYCGFLCSDITERQEKILGDIIDFAKYNPEFAKVMIFKILKMSVDSLGALTKN